MNVVVTIQSAVSDLRWRDGFRKESSSMPPRHFLAFGCFTRLPCVKSQSHLVLLSLRESALVSPRPKPAFGGIGDVPARPDYGLEGVRIRLRSRAVATARLRSLVLPDRSSRAGVPGAARVSQAAFPGGSGVRADGLAGTLAALSLPGHGLADRGQGRGTANARSKK